MIEIQDKTNCMGCHACYNKCPVKAIEMVEDDKGFKYPNVNKEKCINCGLCEKVCPILNKNKIENKPKAFAVKNRNEEIREQSSSGGMFTLLAESVIKDGGVVFGAEFDESWKLKHTCAENIEDLQKFRGSKYLQSTIGDTYKNVKELLTEGRKVLFTGTPCQIEGLKSYLEKEYENLLTQDIICHGVPSPKIHDRYIKSIMRRYKAKNIENITHRTKVKGWKNWCVRIKLDNKEYIKSHNEDIYMQAFLQNITLRESCYNCQFKKKNRISDITLADFWGIEKVVPEMDDDKGTSLVIINSKKGQKIFDELKEKIIYKEVDFEKSITDNPSMTASSKENPNRTGFFDDLDKMSFDKLAKKYIRKKNLLKKIKNYCIKKIKML